MLKDYSNRLKLACGQANDTYKYNTIFEIQIMDKIMYFNQRLIKLFSKEQSLLIMKIPPSVTKLFMFIPMHSGIVLCVMDKRTVFSQYKVYYKTEISHTLW